MPTDEYFALRSESYDRRENNDCAVIAISLATDISYSQAHALLAEFGRKPRQVTNRDWTFDAINKLGFELKDVSKQFNAKTVRTLERQIPETGTYLVRVTRHILCVKDGQVHDWSKGRLKRVSGVWRVMKKNAIKG